MWSRYRDPLAKNRAFVKYARRRVTGTPDYPTETGGIFSGSISRFVHGDRSALKRKSIRLVSVVILILDRSERQRVRRTVQSREAGVGRRGELHIFRTEPHISTFTRIRRNGEHVRITQHHAHHFRTYHGGRTIVFYALDVRAFFGDSLPHVRTRIHRHTSHANIPRSLFLFLSRLNIFITIFCDQKINSIMCYR